jgi:hypothetical protein
MIVSRVVLPPRRIDATRDVGDAKVVEGGAVHVFSADFAARRF